MASLRHVNRDHVLATIRLFDDLGADAFYAATGYRPSTAYTIRHEGRSYPSKAILGVAACLEPRDFFGGIAQALPVLQRLGFVVHRDGRRVSDVGLELAARSIELDGRRPFRPADLDVEPAAIFASGSNRAGEIRGMGSMGIDVGVCATELPPYGEAEAALLALEGTDVQVFVDSGAFGEVRFTDAGPEVVRPITPSDWGRILGLYRRLAFVLGPQAWLVAPDCVGDQDETLRRLGSHAGDLRDLRRLGARILVPMQAGRLDLQTFAAVVDDLLGFEDWVPAFPCKKAATSPEAVADFVEARRPAHVHLLGLGPRNRRLGEYLEPFDPAPVLDGVVRDASDEVPTVSLDANWITANVGRQGRRPRLYTAARDAARLALGVAAPAAAVAELALLAALA